VEQIIFRESPSNLILARVYDYKNIMEYKEAAPILIKLLDRYSFDAEEKEAVLKAIGVLDLASIAKKSLTNKMKTQKAKREKSTEW
jgi:hypothetical protein